MTARLLFLLPILTVLSPTLSQCSFHSVDHILRTVSNYLLKTNVVITQMRLLDTYTGKFVEKDPRNEDFKYAILSHTWDTDGEQTYQGLKKIQEWYAAKSWFPKWMQFSSPLLSRIWTDLNLSPKILHACETARKDGYRYIWIDSCCIDKTSSSELSEAINSMYTWYRRADVCYAYLADVNPDEDPWKDSSSLRGSRWFKRGWTLQELIAPRKLMFLSKGWTVLGSKGEFAELVNAITGISVDALSQKVPLYSFSVAQRLSWAARRETTRVEDRAYSLLGIFDINMPTLYGEGEGAFQRLQEEILRRIPDQSIFAWGNASVYLGSQMLDFDNMNPAPADPPPQLEHQSRQRFTVTAPLPPLSSQFPSLLSQSPDNFAESRRIEAVPLRQLFYHYPNLPAPDYNFTPLGIRMQVPLIPLSAFLPHIATRYMSDPAEMYLVILGCEHVDRPGYLLGRVCRFPSSQSGIKFLWPGCVTISSKKWGQDRTVRTTFQTELIALSAEALARSSTLATVVAVYLSHPGRHSITLSDLDVRRHPHKMINLLLKRTHGELAEPAGGGRSSHADSGQSATVLTLRWPDRHHPSTHWLTISRAAAQGSAEVQDTVTVEYQHALENDGAQLTVVAHVRGMLQGREAIPVAISWTDQTPWESCSTNATSQWVVLDNGEHSTTVVLSLEFFTTNHYLIDARWMMS